MERAPWLSSPAKAESLGSSDSLDPKDLVVLLAQATKGQREAKVFAKQKTLQSESHREADSSEVNSHGHHP